MISENLHNYLIEQFKKRETDLLLRALSNNGSCKYLIMAFISDAQGFCSVVFDREEERFTELNTNVFKDGKESYEKIKL